MAIHDLVTFGYGTLSPSGNMLWMSYIQLTGDDDRENFGELPVYQGLGLTSRPFPADDTGRATGPILRACGNSNGCIVGGRDTRNAGVYGALEDGDTCVHATGPDAIAQVQAKHNRQVMLFTKDADGEGQILLLDGKDGKVQVAYAGAIIEISKDADHVFVQSTTGKASLTLKDDTIILSATNIYLGDPSKATAQLCASTVATIGALASPATPYPGGILPAANIFVAPLGP